MLVLFFIFHIQGQACACLKISVRTGCIPFMKHSTAMTIRISPISLIITLFPVSPRIFKSRVDTQRIMKERRQTRAITQTSAILKICSGASSISVMPLEITPGPHSIGTARGVTVMFLEYSFFSFSFSFTWVKCACSMSYPILKMMIPPAIRKPLVEIPKKWNRNLPHKVKSTSMTNVRAQDFKAMLRRSPALRPRSSAGKPASLRGGPSM